MQIAVPSSIVGGGLLFGTSKRRLFVGVTSRNGDEDDVTDLHAVVEKVDGGSIVSADDVGKNATLGEASKSAERAGELS